MEISSSQRMKKGANLEKYLTFRLGNEEFGIKILKIKEIIGLIDITPMPQAPEFVKGVINLRGKIIPVIDLRLRFGMESKEYDEKTCIIVVEILISDSQTTFIGIVVDSVSEVINISSKDIEMPPQFGTSVNIEFISGIAKVKNKVVLLLDIDKVLTQEEIREII